MRRHTTCGILLAAAGLLAAAAAGAAEKRVLTLGEARRIADAGVAEARRHQAGGAIAVVDDGGHLLYLERLEGTFPAASAVATHKARTAATFRKPTRDFENAVRSGRTALVAVSEMTPLQGGVPIEIDGQVVGAVGVSGAMSAQQDDEVAQVAVAALDRGPAVGAAPPVSDLAAEVVGAAFAEGAPLLETGAYKIHASRRETPGQAEIHARDTDVIYVLEGRATLVTGGEVVDGREVAADELRGDAIAGGEAHELAPGQVLVVPHGTPHWFREVRGPFLYYVVKVTAPGSGS